MLKEVFNINLQFIHWRFKLLNITWCLNVQVTHDKCEAIPSILQSNKTLLGKWNVIYIVKSIMTTYSEWRQKCRTRWKSGILLNLPCFKSNNWHNYNYEVHFPKFESSGTNSGYTAEPVQKDTLLKISDHYDNSQQKVHYLVTSL